jgi:voltage-gated potassium channel
MVELIRGDVSEQRDILLLANVPENPLPEQALFVQAANLSAPEAIRHAGVPQADLVIVLGQDDNESLTAALAVGAVYSRHLVVYFEQASFAVLLRQHCPNAEAVISLSVENTVRTAQDPGSSQVVSQLLSNLDGQTQYRLQVPKDQATVAYGVLFQLFKDQHDATLLGLEDATGKVILNPTSATPVPGGTSLFFMAAMRLCSEQIIWPSQ